MNAGLVFAAMLPEHLLLSGLVALLVLEIVSDEPKGELAVSLVAVGLAALAAGWIAAMGRPLEPFPGQFVVTPSIAWAKAAVLLLAIPVLMKAIPVLFSCRSWCRRNSENGMGRWRLGGQERSACGLSWCAVCISGRRRICCFNSGGVRWWSGGRTEYRRIRFNRRRCIVLRGTGINRRRRCWRGCCWRFRLMGSRRGFG